VEEATALLKEATEKVENIKNDDSIPTRSNKKTGAKSKKEVREQVQAEATDSLKEISVRNGFISGKWLIFTPREKVDFIWSSLASSLTSGPLSLTSTFEAKVATCPKSESQNPQHLLCLYMPNIYDKDAVTEVMRILLKNHGVSLTGVKSNLYTAIGLDSKHVSGIPSTVWKNSALMKDAEMKELKDHYFANINTAKSMAEDKNDAAKESSSNKKKKPVPKKKAVEDDPFASDSEEDSKPSTSKEAKAGPKRPKESDTEDEEHEPPTKKKS